MANRQLLDQIIPDETRLRTIRALALFDTPSEEAFDRLTQLASRIVDAPVSLVSLVDRDRQWFKSMVGLPEPWASQRQTPLSHSFCQHVVATNQPLIVSDSREVDFLKDNLAIPDLNVIAYLGMPLTTSSGAGLGSFCVIDGKPRTWTQDEIDILHDLAGVTMHIIEMRASLIQMHDVAQRKLDQQRRQHEVQQQQAIAGYRELLRMTVSRLDAGEAPDRIADFLRSTPEYAAS
jgi:GAF domain-containing protein